MLSRAHCRSGLRGLVALFAAGGLVVAAACSEQLPKENPPAGPLDAGAPFGLETRPSTSKCVGGKLVAPQAAKIGFAPVTPVKLTEPVEVVEHGGQLYVLEQAGLVKVLSADALSFSTVLDIKSRTVAGGEAGLLGLAFHPSFATNGFVYLYYTAPHPTQPPPVGVVFQSVLARYESKDGGKTIDPTSEKRILVVDQPFANHNGGTVAFGNDGLLYWGLGDGGSGGDPQGNGQNKNTLLGKMLRIDVDTGDPYAVPPSNPFAAGGGKPEIYALGLRNPFRFRFDRKSGDLWAGDVGQGEREEIDKIMLGGNYGWNIREGKSCYNATTCDTTGLIDPVVDHTHAEAASITGGIVYHGATIPELTDKYVYADFVSGYFWAIPTNVASPTAVRLDNDDLLRTSPTAFALDAKGEVLFTSYKGELLRIVPPTATPGMPSEVMPSALSETGCVDATDPTKPAKGLFAYGVNVPQWLDGAEADRFLSVPLDKKIDVRAEGRLELPAGSIAMRTIRAEKKLLETQLLLRRRDGAWATATYVWNADQKDATLLATGGATVRLPSGRMHVVVDPQKCAECHRADVGVTIGLEAGQLDTTFDFAKAPEPGRSGNVLATLDHVGMLATPIGTDAYRLLPKIDSFDSTERRARAYLHANCVSCHHGEAATAMDLRFPILVRDMRICNVAGTLKSGGVNRMSAGHPEDSQIVSAMGLPKEGIMPPLGRSVTHAAALSIVSEWIQSTPVCP